MNFPKKLSHKLKTRKESMALRSLNKKNNLIDFSSNDYLGFAKSIEIFNTTHQFLVDQNYRNNGATGSRLLSGNHPLYQQVEKILCDFHQSESATIFNSGYDANLGFFGSVPQRGDVILYDAFIHASIRDGIQLSNAKAYKFLHNDLNDLEKRLQTLKTNSTNQDQEIYIVTETVFSMDGDSPDLQKMSSIVKKYNARLIVDEAHAVGVFEGGVTQNLKLEDTVFARIITFGKALGCHGAAILASKELQSYLVNFTRSLIYTTALSPHALATIRSAYNTLINSKENRQKLHQNIAHFIAEVKRLQLHFIPSCSSIHCSIIGGNQQTKNVAKHLQEKGFDVKPILSPTIPQNQERLRFCLHACNSKEQITEVLQLLSIFVN